MNWKTCKLVALQTMYANEGATLNADDTNQDYIDAMPAKANEAMHQLALVGRPILKQFRFELTHDLLEKSVPSETLVLPVGGLHVINLTDYIPRFRAVDRIMMQTERGYGPLTDWDLEGDNVLVLPARQPGTVTLWYKAYPKIITTATPDEEELDLPEEAAALVPIYMAAELYKEDDLALATVLRNQFEDGMEKIRAAYAQSGGSARMMPKRNTTGWW